MPIRKSQEGGFDSCILRDRCYRTDPTFIAHTLVLSISTVRTHVRNIYRKVNVSSQEELLALIDGAE
ncbi:MAG: LuxR C-terminal-related transcriptional regulator [Gordonibacter sp.]|nr:LuxR C-terminal-related transcriptional regulator [Gordonibacter sp.]